jgi:hypothetical protein
MKSSSSPPPISVQPGAKRITSGIAFAVALAFLHRECLSNTYFRESWHSL